MKVMKPLTYKNYSARIDYDDEDVVFYGKIAGISDVISFHAGSAKALKAAFQKAVDDYIETCAAVGKEPQRPYSGRMIFHVDPDVHRRAEMAAALAGKSLNQWAEDILAEMSKATAPV